LSQESSASSISSAVDSNPGFSIEHQQILSYNISLVLDDPALWPESFSEQERVDLIKKGQTQVKAFDFSADETGRKFNICFCCELFSNRKMFLSSAENCSQNRSQKLKGHDASPDHVNTM
jgi:hypothetical protein